MLIRGVSAPHINPPICQGETLDSANHLCVINLAVCMIMPQLFNSLLIKTAGEEFIPLYFSYFPGPPCLVSPHPFLPTHPPLCSTCTHAVTHSRFDLLSAPTKPYKKIKIKSKHFFVMPWFCLWTQTAASTASWPASSANSSLFATWWWPRPRAARARRRPAAAAAALTTWETTATAPATWTAASWTPAASPRTAWKSAWSAAASVFQHRSMLSVVLVSWSAMKGINGPWKENERDDAAVKCQIWHQTVGRRVRVNVGEKNKISECVGE